MRILIVGAGSTGGYFGGRLAAAGRDVTFLVRPARAERLRADGLQIVSPMGDLKIRPNFVTADQIEGPFDAVLLTVKAYALDAALEDMAPAVGPDTVILPVLNGMKHVDIIRARFGDAALGGCVCKVATTLDDRGRIVQLGKMQELAYGEMDGSRSERMERLDAFLQGAGFDARLAADIEREMWEKWLMLASLGGITCLMRGTVGEVEAAPGGRAFVHRFLDEVTGVVRAVGREPDEGALATVRSMLTQKGSPQTSSMYRDLLKDQPIEAEQIIGDLLARARQAGLDTPLLAAADTHLAVYQGKIAG
ncbi:2-dehydropantoate 2-reductase [Labrys monachus]|uniref:2-dehydropantoate 2-reductase n=1 Tax=Labrys monachus TaxID=217067 RepID=A0ABU0FF79_9HYPH|nr:2-dehydropantoate 2-reductase [Labrys monachus]MDQ0392763.1 2-dehydropantoate 2-reductase [Labrys monachus]